MSPRPTPKPSRGRAGEEAKTEVVLGSLDETQLSALFLASALFLETVAGILGEEVDSWSVREVALEVIRRSIGR